MSSLLSKDEAPFLIGVFLSVIAWAVNGLIVELGERKLVQYELSNKVVDDHRRFVARITNLSGQKAINGAIFVIRPAAGTSLVKVDEAYGKVSFPSAVDLKVTGPGQGEPPQFDFQVIPPGAYFDLLAFYKKTDARPKLAAIFKSRNVDPNMKLVSSGSFEAILLRNQILIYLGLLFLAFLVVGVWTARLLRG